MIEKTADEVHDVELELDKLLGFKRVAGFGTEPADLARTMDATYNKIGAEAVPPG